MPLFTLDKISRLNPTVTLKSSKCYSNFLSESVSHDINSGKLGNYWCTIAGFVAGRPLTTQLAIRDKVWGM